MDLIVSKTPHSLVDGLDDLVEVTLADISVVDGDVILSFLPFFQLRFDVKYQLALVSKEIRKPITVILNNLLHTQIRGAINESESRSVPYTVDGFRQLVNKRMAVAVNELFARFDLTMTITHLDEVRYA